MNEQLKKLADKAANEIADQFRPGFFDDRMVEDVANIIYKHYKKPVNRIKKEAYRQGRSGYMGQFGNGCCDVNTALVAVHEVLQSKQRGQLNDSLDQGYAKAHGRPSVESDQESYADAVSHWHYWQNKADEYKLELENLKEQQSIAWNNWNGAVNNKLKNNNR